MGLPLATTPKMPGLPFQLPPHNQQILPPVARTEIHIAPLPFLHAELSSTHHWQ